MRLMMAMFQLCLLMEEAARKVLRHYGLTLQDVVVMNRLQLEPWTSGSLIAERIGRSRQNVQRTLMRLQLRGLIEADVPYEGQRSTGWGLTGEGKRCLETIRTNYDEREQRLLAGTTRLRTLAVHLETVVSELLRLPVAIFSGPIRRAAPPQAQVEWPESLWDAEEEPPEPASPTRTQ